MYNLDLAVNFEVAQRLRSNSFQPRTKTKLVKQENQPVTQQEHLQEPVGTHTYPWNITVLLFVDPSKDLKLTLIPMASLTEQDFRGSPIQLGI